MAFLFYFLIIVIGDAKDINLTLFNSSRTKFLLTITFWCFDSFYTNIYLKQYNLLASIKN